MNIEEENQTIYTITLGKEKVKKLVEIHATAAHILLVCCLLYTIQILAIMNTEEQSRVLDLILLILVKKNNSYF